MTAPQILPGMSAGGLLVFLTAMKELPITLLLSPIGFDTLATADLGRRQRGVLHASGAAGADAGGGLGVAVLLMLRREQERT